MSDLIRRVGMAVTQLAKHGKLTKGQQDLADFVCSWCREPLGRLTPVERGVIEASTKDDREELYRLHDACWQIVKRLKKRRLIRPEKQSGPKLPTKSAPDVKSTSAEKLYVPPPRLRSVPDRHKKHRYIPDIPVYRGPLVELIDDHDRLKKGHRGRLGGGYGTSCYNWHEELPVNGIGVPRTALLVVELDDNGMEVKTPYLKWCRALGLEVVCNRCDRDIVGEKPTKCGAR